MGGKFLDYWEQHGGLAQQGYPISDEFQEKSDLDGKTYTVQYFERAVFELHPENQAPYDVLLSQLGTSEYKAKTSLTFTDSTGTKVTLTKRPQRIVCLIWHLRRYPLYARYRTGGRERQVLPGSPVMGADKTFPAITGGFASPNLEDIAKVNPDLVIGFIPHAGLRDALKPIAPLFIMNPAKYQDTFEEERAIGYLTGKSYQAEQAIQKLHEQNEGLQGQAPNNKVPLMLFGNTANSASLPRARCSAACWQRSPTILAARSRQEGAPTRSRALSSIRWSRCSRKIPMCSS